MQNLRLNSVVNTHKHTQSHTSTHKHTNYARLIARIKVTVNRNDPLTDFSTLEGVVKITFQPYDFYHRLPYDLTTLQFLRYLPPLWRLCWKTVENL